MAIEVYPVVHVYGEVHAREQASLALEQGADGVFLISHKNLPVQEVLRYAGLVADDNPDSFVGINPLGSSPAEAFTIMANQRREVPDRKLPAAMWVDDASRDAAVVPELRAEYPFLSTIRYLGGVAFKYTSSYTADPAQAAQETLDLKDVVDVVTTTGPSTARPPSLAKVSAMKQAAGDTPLAVASGISYENIARYDGIVDQVVVGTSIKNMDGFTINPRILRSLVELAHSL